MHKRKSFIARFTLWAAASSKTTRQNLVPPKQKGSTTRRRRENLCPPRPDKVMTPINPFWNGKSRSALECGKACDVFAEDETVNVFSSLVRIYAF